MWRCWGGRGGGHVVRSVAGEDMFDGSIVRWVVVWGAVTGWGVVGKGGIGVGKVGLGILVHVVSA